MHLPRFFVLIFLSLLLSGCELFNAKVEIPSYLEVNSVNLQVDSIKQGTSSSKISDIWVYIDGDLQGVYELPAKFPVQQSGLHQIEIIPGIKMSGVSSIRSEYKFFNGYTTSKLMKKDSVHVLNPTVTYASFSNFIWLENFDNIGLTFGESSRSSKKMELADATDSPFGIKKCGKFSLGGDYLFFEGVTKESYVLPKAGAAVYLEMNFKVSQVTSVGVYANGAAGVVQKEVVRLNPTVNSDGTLYWNKIYINLTEVVSNQINADDFRIFVSALLDTDEASSAEYYFDNFKLIY